ncbi:3-oxoacyl-[acyl-carrier-protein] synthase 2 [Pseudogymnoascus sp. WSF 3629]|nr:3-oxoacyl-[acyl-carrier-protein] synthase 2 [Pseudogymnoascus sp. WSF 3629]
MRRVVITGLGAVTPLGASISRTWRGIIAGKSGLVATPDSEEYRAIPSRVAGLVPMESRQNFTEPVPKDEASESKASLKDLLWNADEWLSSADQRRMAKYTQYAIAASDMALADAGWNPKPGSIGAQDTGVCLGSGIGNFEEIYDTSITYHKGGYKKVSPLFVPKLLINLAAGHITMRHSFLGPNHSVSTACTTGAHSIGDAARFIAFGDASVMVAGGSESCIHPLALAGFARSRSLSSAYNSTPSAASRPFDSGRDGFVMGEGAGVMVLEELEHAKARGAQIYAEVLGYGSSADAYHMTAPREDGAGALLAMRRALRAAGVKPREVGYVNAHATSTVIGDAAEAAAIGTLMLGEEGVENKGDVTVSSTKGAMGHLLGAAGAVEAIFAVLAIKEGVVPPTLNLHRPDPDRGFNYVPLHAQDKSVDVAISNSFGFGGTNATLVFAKEGYRG